MNGWELRAIADSLQEQAEKLRTTADLIDNLIESSRIPQTQVQKFGAEVRRRRTEDGLSQGELSKMLENIGSPMHQTTISKIESGQQEPSLSQAHALAIVLGVS